MTNPAESTSSAAPGVTPQRDLWLARALDVGLGIVWWTVLLIPEHSRPFLLNHELPGLAFAFLRVVCIVSAACLFFRFAYRRRPRLSALTAMACLWGGAAAFLVTGSGDISSREEVLDAFVALPWLFIALAWYVVLPMTALTAVVLARAEQLLGFTVVRQPSAGFQSMLGK